MKAVDVEKEEQQATDATLWEAARTEAAKTHPYPKTVPSLAGIFGGVGTYIALEFFMAIAAIDREQHGLALLITSLLGFALPFLYVRHAQNSHFSQVQRRYDDLQFVARSRADRQRHPHPDRLT